MFKEQTFFLAILFFSCLSNCGAEDRELKNKEQLNFSSGKIELQRLKDINITYNQREFWQNSSKSKRDFCPKFHKRFLLLFIRLVKQAKEDSKWLKVMEKKYGTSEKGSKLTKLTKNISSNLRKAKRTLKRFQILCTKLKIESKNAIRYVLTMDFALEKKNDKWFFSRVKGLFIKAERGMEILQAIYGKENRGVTKARKDLESKRHEMQTLEVTPYVPSDLLSR
ncbi:hypothetical protein ACFL35_19890 [Candidatus Riflebacteria bacterium]